MPQEELTRLLGKAHNMLILHDGDRDHMNRSMLTVEQSMLVANLIGQTIHHLNDKSENDLLRAALYAQEEAEQANNTRTSYEHWQRLEDKAKELRRAALNLPAHEQKLDGTK